MESILDAIQRSRDLGKKAPCDFCDSREWGTRWEGGCSECLEEAAGDYYSAASLYNDEPMDWERDQDW